MKIYISIDIEGITTTTFWDETIPGKPEYSKHVEQMNKELLSACNGAINAGATEILIRDAHGYANNIDQSILPNCAKIIRGWSGHPYLMVEGIDKSFDAALFIGYHSGASKSGNPLSHTETLNTVYVKINDKIVSEFDIFANACILEKVPVVFLSGDKDLCTESKQSFPSLTTCITKEGKGASTLNYNSNLILEEIRSNVEHSLVNISNVINPELAEKFKLEICYKDHTKAEANSYFPGVKKINSNTIVFENNNYYEILRAFKFLS